MFEDNKINKEDLVDKGVMGLADTPNLSTSEMQRKFDELSKDVIIPKFNDLVQALYEAGLDKDVKADSITNIRVNKDGMLEYSTDGGNNYNGTASSGHLIMNGIGSVFPNRSRMQFSDNVGISDDAENNATIISVPSGVQGEKGDGATIQVGNVTSGDTPEVINVGSENDAILDFVLPKGEKGNAATIQVGSVTKGDSASVSNRGTSSNAILDFVLPKGDKGDDGTSFQILGMYETYDDLISVHPTGTRGAAYAVGTSENNVVYNWDVSSSTWKNLGPLKGAKGDKGDTATLTIGEVTSGSNPAVENIGTSNDAILNITLPEGLKGETGNSATVSVGSVTKGNEASVTNVGTPNNAIFNFVLPKGDPATVNGIQPDVNGNITISAETLGAMKLETYDSDRDGIVDNAKKLNGHDSNYFQKTIDETLNTTNKTISGAINELAGKSVDTLTTMEQVEAATDDSIPVGAGAIKEVNNSLVANIYVGDDGKLHKVQGGADSVLPFNSGINFKTLLFFYNTNKFDIPTNFGNELTIIVTAYSGSGSSYSKKMVTINSATNATFETIDIYSANIGTNYLSTAIYKINIIDGQKPEFTISLSSNNICVSILA